MNSNEKIKSCPCGSTPQASKELYHCLYRPSMNGWHIVCWTCNMLFGFDIDYGGVYKYKKDAIKAWNEWLP